MVMGIEIGVIPIALDLALPAVGTAQRVLRAMFGRAGLCLSTGVVTLGVAVFFHCGVTGEKGRPCFLKVPLLLLLIIDMLID